MYVCINIKLLFLNVSHISISTWLYCWIVKRRTFSLNNFQVEINNRNDTISSWKKIRN